MARILVTGGAGFIGSHLVDRLLERGDEVVCFDNFNDFYDPAIKRRNAELLAGQGATIVEGDIRDEARVAEVFADGFDGVAAVATGGLHRVTRSRCAGGGE